MARKLTVVISQGQSHNPAKRKLEEDLVGLLLFESNIEVAVIPNLYDLTSDGTGILALQGIPGDMVVCSWMFSRAAHWTLDRQDIRGGIGEAQLVLESDEDDEDEEPKEEKDHVADARPLPKRTIWCLDFKASQKSEDYVKEIRRIAQDTATETVDLMGWIGGSPSPEQTERFLSPGPGNVDSNNTAEHNGNGHATNGHAASETTDATDGKQDDAEATSNQPAILQEDADRRWYPVIDFSRCTNCLECIDFCLFGVYGIDAIDTILVEQPDNCRKGCPACSRVCPENAIIFPQHKTPAIAGSNEAAGTLKIDLSKLFGAPDKDPLEIAALERDEQLVMTGRDAVGMTVGVPKRQTNLAAEPKDELDNLMDELDELDI